MYSNPFHNTDISKSTFLVTGGAGFIGSNIVEYLLKYNAGKVIILDNLSTGFSKNIETFIYQPNFEFIEGDICNSSECKKACLGVDYVFHQAALGSVPRSIKDPLSTHNANATGFLNILIAARDANVKRFVYASSSSVYGDSLLLPKQESLIGNQLSPYAVTKRINELYASVFALNYEMPIIGLRYFNVFGPRQSPEGAYAAAIPLFMDALLKNKEVNIDGDGYQTRDFTFVENAVQANIKACFTDNKDALAQVFNVATADRTSILQLYTILKELTGATINANHREIRKGDIRDSLADISKSTALLNYLPAVKLKEGLAITLNWFKTL
jgi:UDP-N-acetylglucosamine 4-epimerase